jgi:hypothetical protein
LGRIYVISGEQNNATDQRVAKALTVNIGQLGAADIDHQRAEGKWLHGRSRMT